MKWPVQFNVRMSELDKKLIDKAAARAGETTSGWVRRALLAAARKEFRS